MDFWLDKRIINVKFSQFYNYILVMKKKAYWNVNEQIVNEQKNAHLHFSDIYITGGKVWKKEEC